MTPLRPLVSVVMAVCNEARHLATAVESILAQEAANFELIVVDDASSDATPDILNKLRQRDGRIRIVTNTANAGMGRSFNRAIELAQGQYLARMDGDDIALPGRFSAQIDALNADKRLGVVGGHIQLIDVQGRTVGERYYPLSDTDLKRQILRFSPFAHPATMIRREALLQERGYDWRFTPAEDLDLWCRIGRHWTFANLPRFVLQYRVHYGSMTARYSKHMQWQTLMVRCKAVARYGYRPSPLDVVYSLAQLIVLPMPYRHKMKIFEHYRRIVGKCV